MATIIRQRKVEWVQQYERRYVDAKNTCLAGIPCDKDGNRLEPEIAAQRWIREGVAKGELFDAGVHSWDKKEVTPGILKCECGEEIALWGYGNGNLKCDCGRWYNGAGQELNPPSMWGEETGERFDDNGNYIGGGEY